MTNNTEMNSKNQRDESTPLVVDHGNTTEEEGMKMSMITMATTIRRSPKALLLLGLAATAAVSNTAWNQYQTLPLVQLNSESGGGGDTPTPNSACTQRGGDTWYHPRSYEHFHAACCPGLHEVNENGKFICR
mmetsp:Transcript_28067/g.30255  ORF Transcript_28067/g.30255 Transcript_28067/m.30255 type:complete len:132 (-) Transcript_28067:64-459(-)